MGRGFDIRWLCPRGWPELAKPVYRAEGMAAVSRFDFANLQSQLRQMRSDTSDWRQYWNTPTNEHWNPKVENLCRDNLLSDLRRVLPPDVSADPEGVYADDRRADIRVTHGNVNVPVEIKRSNHKDVWTAMEDQLINSYAKDPNAGGYGIYLVFWFGKEHCTPYQGKRPKTLAKFEQDLQQLLKHEEAQRITVMVIDVARPLPK